MKIFQMNYAIEFSPLVENYYLRASNGIAYEM